MITIPDPIKKYFKIINEDIIVIRPPLSKISTQCAVVFGLPIMMFLIAFADGFDKIDPPTLHFSIIMTLVFFSYGYFIALPGLRGRITLDLKSRIIHTAHGRHLEFKSECPFDNAAFSYDSDFIQVSADGCINVNRIYFHDKKYKEVFYELSLKDDSVEYEIMLEFLEEICKPISNSSFQKMQQHRIKETFKNGTLTDVIPDGKEKERNKFDKLLD